MSIAAMTTLVRRSDRVIMACAKRNRAWDRNLMEWTLDYNKSFGADENIN